MDSLIQGQLKEWFLMAAAWGCLGWCVYLIASTFRRKQQNDMQKHMLEKFASAKDFADFVQSPAGQKYVMGFTNAVTSPRNSILSSVQTGCVLMFGGAGFLAGNRGWIAERIGFVSFLAGIGFLVSAFISYFLAKRIRSQEQEKE